MKRELLRAQEEVRRIQSVPLVIGQFLEMVDNSNGIVGSTTGTVGNLSLPCSFVLPLIMERDVAEFCSFGLYYMHLKKESDNEIKLKN